MPHCTRTKQDVEGRVVDMFRLAERDYDLTIKRLVALTGMDAGSLNNYKNGAAIPLHAFVQLCRYIPDELTSLCLEPAEKHVGTDEPSDGGPHDLAEDSGEYSRAFAEATRPDSPGGPSIVHSERLRLAQIHRRMRTRRIAA